MLSVSEVLLQFANDCSHVQVGEHVVAIPYVMNSSSVASAVTIRTNPVFVPMWHGIERELLRIEADLSERRNHTIDNDCYTQSAVGKVQPSVARHFLLWLASDGRTVLQWFEEALQQYLALQQPEQLQGVRPGDRQLIISLAEKLPDTAILLHLFMFVYGIGIDCSGFVSYALSHAMRHIGLDAKQQEDTLGLQDDCLKPSAIKLCQEGGAETLFGYHTTQTSFSKFAYNTLQPGDIITKHPDQRAKMEHIYIIIDVVRDENDQALSFVAADSTSGKGRKGVDVMSYAIPSSGVVDLREETFEMTDECWYYYHRPRCFVNRKTY